MDLVRFLYGTCTARGQNKSTQLIAKCLILLVGDAGFEPTAFGSGELYKMQLIQ